MAHAGRVLDGRVLDGRVLDGRVLDGRVLDGRVLDGRVLAHMTHGPAASALRPAASGQRPAPWQRRGRGGRAERLRPQLRSVCTKFLFLWYKAEHDVTAVIYQDAQGD